MAVKALAKHYFDTTELPLNVCRIERKENITHAFDLTEIEHFHDFTELVFIVRGQGVQIIEQQEYAVKAGDVFVLQGNQKHFFRDAEGIELINVMFDTRVFGQEVSPAIQKLDGYNALFILESNYRASHHFRNRLHLDRSEMAKMELILNTMIFEQEHKQEGYQLILSNKLEELLVVLSRHYSRLDATEAQSLIRISKIIEFLEQNFAQKIYVEDLAEMAFMSLRNFQRIFKKAVGSTPSQYLMQIRLQRARRLLRSSSLSVADIAAQTGLTDSNYFIKSFKKELGITPVKFRMRYKQKA